MPLQKIPYEVIEQAIESDEYIGYCLACGSEHEGIEPDAREYLCDQCSSHQVYGAEEILIMGMADMEE